MQQVQSQAKVLGGSPFGVCECCGGTYILRLSSEILQMIPYPSEEDSQRNPFKKGNSTQP